MIKAESTPQASFPLILTPPRHLPTPFSHDLPPRFQQQFLKANFFRQKKWDIANRGALLRLLPREIRIGHQGRGVSDDGWKPDGASSGELSPLRGMRRRGADIGKRPIHSGVWPSEGGRSGALGGV